MKKELSENKKEPLYIWNTLAKTERRQEKVERKCLKTKKTTKM